MSVVRPELGPSLPELLGPRVRASPRPLRHALAVLAIGAALLALWAVVLRGGQGEDVTVVREPVAFNFLHRAPLHRVAPGPGELARAAAPGQSFSVRELRLPAYRGSMSGFLPIYASGLEAQMAQRYPDFQWRSDGRANINKVQGYEIVFQYRGRGGLVFGRRVLVLPTDTARLGLDILVLARRTLAIPNADAVGHNGVLKTALRSFRLGTQRP